jgi:hypothetical protein
MRKLVLALVGLSLFSAAPVAHAGSFEDEVLTELNYARANPRSYARELRRYDAAYERDRGWDDPEAVEDAVDFLMRQRPLAPLRRDRGLEAAAALHADAQGPRGGVGHGASGSLSRRLQSQGVYAGLAAEAISYGQPTPRDVVRQLIIDSGVPNRGHRRDIFNGAYEFAGVACGRHARYSAMCVINFTGVVMRR